jgi:MoxR-like ATPase
VLGHRVVLDYSARIEGRTSRDVVAAILKEVPVTDAAVPRPLTAA